MSEYDAYLGGESGHRGFFGGTAGKTRTILLILAFVLMVIFTPTLGIWGLLIGLSVAVVSFVLTQRTDRGSVLERHERKRRWKMRKKLGIDRFTPYNVAAWDQAHEELKQLHKVKGKEAAERRAQLGSEIVAMRANPDGADGMGWLQSAPLQPGIAWHTPRGEDAYLSVAFSVTGPLRGIESGSTVASIATRYSQFLAARAKKRSLISTVQPITRVLPADTALQQSWVSQNLDEDAPHEAQLSYAEVLDKTGAGAMNQRHICVMTWPLTPAFFDLAAKHGEGRDGWRGLMAAEIAGAINGLEHAKLGPARALSARETAAVILNQQNPDWPADWVAGVTPSNFGLPSYDEWSAYVVDGINPFTDEEVQWWHRTAAIKAEHLAVNPRTPLWMIELLRGSELDCVRSVSFHIRLVPAREAKARAQSDRTKDMAAMIEDKDKGRQENDEVVTRKTAAEQRVADLAAGTGHHGVEWVGYITLSARTRSDLGTVCRDLADLADSEAGIDQLVWLDTYQSAAAGTTWPIGRGLGVTKKDLISHGGDILAGRTAKEELV